MDREKEEMKDKKGGGEKEEGEERWRKWNGRKCRTRNIRRWRKI